MHQYLMEALINPHFKHLKVTLSQSSCFLHLRSRYTDLSLQTVYV